MTLKTSQIRRLAFCLAVVFAASACNTVTIRDKGIRKYSNDPTYEDSKSFFLGGLVGEHRVDGKQICHGNTPVQMQAQTTFVEGFLTIITLLIYAPRTVKVWCPATSTAAASTTGSGT